MPDRPVVTLDISVLLRLAGLDVVQRNALLPAKTIGVERM